MLAIDLNADLGEECGHDDSLMAIVTSANVAAGGHAGGGAVLDATVRAAAAAGVAVGAHPSYPDRSGFGRRSMAESMSPADISAAVAAQVAAVVDATSRVAARVRHVKAHGALYHDANVDPVVARAVIAGAREAAGDVVIVGQPNTEIHRRCERMGIAFAAEAFADRAYAPDGSLVLRHLPGSVIADPAAVAERVARLVIHNEVVAVDGSVLRLAAATVCVHGDTTGAVEVASAIRRRLESHGIVLTSVQGP